MKITRSNQVFLAVLSSFCLAACDKVFTIDRDIQFEGNLTPSCVELSAMAIGLEAALTNDFQNRPIEEYFSHRIRRPDTASMRTTWNILRPQSLNLSYSTIGTSDSENEQAVCDLMSDFTSSFSTQCGGGLDSVVVEDSFQNTSCVFTR